MCNIMAFSLKKVGNRYIENYIFYIFALLLPNYMYDDCVTTTSKHNETQHHFQDHITVYACCSIVGFV